jgi:multidrug efflux pump subunit AcrB
MAEFFIRRPIVAMVIAIVTVIVGLVTLSRLPIAEYPQVSPTLIEVTANYRGAAAEAVMDSVAIPIESKVNGVDKMLYMQSFSANDGKMVLKVTFDVGTNVDIMQVNTQNCVSLATAQLPDAVKREGVSVNRSSPDLLMVLGLYSPKGSYDAVFLGNYADINLVDAIKRVSGVGDVKNFTAQDYAMRIWLQPNKMAALAKSHTPPDITPPTVPFTKSGSLKNGSASAFSARWRSAGARRAWGEFAVNDHERLSMVYWRPISSIGSSRSAMATSRMI